MMGLEILGYMRVFWVGSNEDAGVEDLGGYVFLRELHSCSSMNR